jgi:hypothetical protein
LAACCLQLLCLQGACLLLVLTAACWPQQGHCWLRLALACAFQAGPAAHPTSHHLQACVDDRTHSNIGDEQGMGYGAVLGTTRARTEVAGNTVHSMAGNHGWQSWLAIKTTAADPAILKLLRWQQALGSVLKCALWQC